MGVTAAAVLAAGGPRTKTMAWGVKAIRFAFVTGTARAGTRGAKVDAVEEATGTPKTTWTEGVAPARVLAATVARTVARTCGTAPAPEPTPRDAARAKTGAWASALLVAAPGTISSAAAAPAPLPVAAGDITRRNTQGKRQDRSGSSPGDTAFSRGTFGCQIRRQPTGCGSSTQHQEGEHRCRPTDSAQCHRN